MNTDATRDPRSLVCLRGLPGSGKTTMARGLLKYGDTVRLNRDDLRKSLFNKEGILAHEQEEMITKIQRSMAAEALAAGLHVVVDDTHLRNRYIRAWNEFALKHNAYFDVIEVNTPVDVCVARDSVRERKVGEEVIRDLAQKFQRNGEFPEYQRITKTTDSVDEKYVPNLDAPHAIIVDIDGTLAHNDGHRGWYDLTKVKDDKVHQHILNLIVREIYAGTVVLFVSGREGTQQCYEDTLAWLHDHLPKGYQSCWALYMRQEGDGRKDSVVKREIFDKEIRNEVNVQYVLDDRNSVVRMWRSLGLPCLQVADGDF